MRLVKVGTAYINADNVDAVLDEPAVPPSSFGAHDDHLSTKDTCQIRFRGASFMPILLPVDEVVGILEGEEEPAHGFPTIQVARVSLESMRNYLKEFQGRLKKPSQTIRTVIHKLEDVLEGGKGL
jgi:hypothetical protein